MTPCTVCGASTHTALCDRCVKQLEQALAEMPRDAADLQLVATRQAAGPLGLGDPRRQWDGQPTSESWGGSESWVYAPGASDQLWALQQTLTAWVEHLADERGLTPPPMTREATTRTVVVERRVTIRRNRWHIANTPHTITTREQRPADPILTAAAWLLACLPDIAASSHAAQFHDEITALRIENHTWTMGRVGDLEFFGTCDDPDIRVDAVPIEGPRCPGLTSCGHDTCDTIRTGQRVLSPRVAICGAELRGRPDDQTIRCDQCGASYDAARLRARNLDRLAGTLGTIVEVAQALSTRERPVTVEALNSAVRRGRIATYGVNARGHRLVRVGEVRAYLEAAQSPRRRAV